MEENAYYSPVSLRLATLRACEHNVEDEEGEKNTEHADKLQNWSNGNVAVLLSLSRLDKRRDHYADAKEVADVGEVDVEVPANHGNIVKYAERGDHTDKTERAINGLENKLCSSAFDHNVFLFLLLTLEHPAGLG